MPIRILPKDEKPKSWITKKKKPTEWIKRKSPTDIRKKIIDKLSGGREAKPHSSPEGRRASAGRKFGRMFAQANRGMRDLKPKKKKDYVTDSDATFGGKRIKKQGPEIKVSNTQADLSKRKRLGLKRGSGRGGRMKDLPDHLRHSLVNQAKHRATHKSGGRIGLKHGGSAGAAKRGHGAEIK